ncbi:MAG: SRPBCC domain-containing protein [Saprospiraceae bacterium]|nr:SRPBCC domain-containing protein [Saprospiraceae bacterium]
MPQTTQTSHENKALKAAPVIVEESLNAPVEKVWKAITDRDQMAQWYFDLAEFRPELGFEFRFTGGPAPEKQYLHICKITEVELGKKLTYSWRYEGYEGESFVTFLLLPMGDNTVLRLTHAGLETFPTDNPDFASGNFVEGWNEIIRTALKQFLEG